MVDAVPHHDIHRLTNIVDVMHRRSMEIYREKKRALEEGDEAVAQQVGEGRDIMSVLREFRLGRWNKVCVTESLLPSTVRENMLASADDRMPEDELIGQMT